MQLVTTFLWTGSEICCKFCPLKYNLFHLRLTDDQAFNVRLDSVPQLANPASNNTQEIYTAQELRDLVAYADTLGIIIVPEIDVPGHAGGWLGMVKCRAPIPFAPRPYPSTFRTPP